MKLEILSDGNLSVSTDATEIGEERTTIPVKVTGDVNIIALNADYVLDVLGALSSEDSVKLEMDSKMSPAVFKTLSGTDFVHLVMPLKM